jgi:hypothetical protein
LEALVLKMENPFADIVENQVNRHTTRLSFDEMCAFYSALCEGVAPVVVARASGLQQTTIASLRAAGTWHAGQHRYPKVAAEYRSLGRDAFIHKYVTAAIRDRLRVAADQVKRNKLGRFDAGGANPRANRFAGAHTLKDPMGFPPQTFLIEFDRGPKPGWAWRDQNDPDLRGDPRHEERRFATSQEAFNFCRLRFTPTEAQMDTPEYAQAVDDSYFYANKSYLTRLTNK